MDFRRGTQSYPDWQRVVLGFHCLFMVGSHQKSLEDAISNTVYKDTQSLTAIFLIKPNTEFPEWWFIPIILGFGRLRRP